MWRRHTAPRELRGKAVCLPRVITSKTSVGDVLSGRNVHLTSSATLRCRCAVLKGLAVGIAQCNKHEHDVVRMLLRGGCDELRQHALKRLTRTEWVGLCVKGYVCGCVCVCYSRYPLQHVACQLCECSQLEYGSGTLWGLQWREELRCWKAAHSAKDTDSDPDERGLIHKGIIQGIKQHKHTHTQIRTHTHTHTTHTHTGLPRAHTSVGPATGGLRRAASW